MRLGFRVSGLGFISQAGDMQLGSEISVFGDSAPFSPLGEGNLERARERLYCPLKGGLCGDPCHGRL